MEDENTLIIKLIQWMKVISSTCWVLASAAELPATTAPLLYPRSIYGDRPIRCAC